MEHVNIMYLQTILSILLLSTSTAGTREETTFFSNNGNILEIAIPDVYEADISSGLPEQKHVVIGPLTTGILNITNIPQSTHFILLQAHAFQHNVTLSFSDVLIPHKHVNGTNIGLVEYANKNSSSMQFFILNQNDVNVSVLVGVQMYGRNAPVPGGCNMEFTTETAPYLLVHYTKSVVIVESQSASLPELQSKCSVHSRAVKLEVYRLYLPERDFTPETYFAYIKRMMAVKDIETYGTKIPEAHDGPSLRRVFSAYPGTGSVYAVVATSKHSASAYVPYISYACGNGVFDNDACDIITEPMPVLLCALMLFLGLLMCFCGHRFFKTQTALLGFLVSFIASYIVLSRNDSTSSETTLTSLSVFTSLCFTLVWLLLWKCFGVPILSVLLTALALGYLIASVLMFGGLEDVILLQWDVNFWTVFVSIMCVFAVLVFPMMHRVNILTCAVLGSFAVVVVVDDHIGSNIKYIIINIIRRATVPEFRNAFVYPPFQLGDHIVSILWGTLSFFGVLLQLWLQRGKPPFPPFHCRLCDINVREVAHISSERNPLLVDWYSHGYGGTDSDIPPSSSSRSLPWYLRFKLFFSRKFNSKVMHGTLDANA